MKVTPRVLVALALAGAVAITPAASVARPSRDTTTCPKTYTVAMFRNAAITNWWGTRTPTRRDTAHMRHFVRCSRHPWRRRAMMRIWRRSAAMNQTRRLRLERTIYIAHSQPESPLAACIIYRESRGDPRAVDGQYEGIAQWSHSSWTGGGGLQFGYSPLDATYHEQVYILNLMLPAQAGQWRPYDGC